MDRWIKNSKGGLTLKTDLYDGALSTYNLIPLFAQRCERIIGTDVSLEVAMVAKRGMVTEWNDWATFISKKDIIVSLKGLQRRLKPEGALIVTLDNPSN